MMSDSRKLTCDWSCVSVIYRELERVCLTSEEDRVPVIVVDQYPRTSRRSDDLRHNGGEHQQQVRHHVTATNQHCHEQH